MDKTEPYQTNIQRWLVFGIEFLSGLLFRGIGLAGVAMMFGGPGIWAYETLIWYKAGIWPGWSLGNVLSWIGLGLLRTRWVETQVVVDWIGYQSAGATIGIAGVVLYVAGRVSLSTLDDANYRRSLGQPRI